MLTGTHPFKDVRGPVVALLTEHLGRVGWLVDAVARDAHDVFAGVDVHLRAGAESAYASGAESAYAPTRRHDHDIDTKVEHHGHTQTRETAGTVRGAGRGGAGFATRPLCAPA